MNSELNRFYQKERLRKDRKSLFKKLSLPSYVCALLRKKNEVQTIKWKIVCLHKMRLKLSGRTDTSLLWIEKNRCKITKNCNCVHEMNLRFHKWWPRQLKIRYVNLLTLKRTKQITMCYIQHEWYLYLSLILLQHFGWYKCVNMIDECKVLHTNKNRTCVWIMIFYKSYEIEHWHKQKKLFVSESSVISSVFHWKRHLSKS